MNMMRKAFLCSIFTLMAVAACAQWSVGARFGGASGLSWKHYNRANTAAFEVLTGFNFDRAIDGLAISPFFEKLAPLTGNGKFAAIFGPGVNVIFGDKTYLGASGILGFDLRVGRVGFQADWMPTFIFINKTYFNASNAALTVRWVFAPKK